MLCSIPTSGYSNLSQANSKLLSTPCMYVLYKYIYKYSKKMRASWLTKFFDGGSVELPWPPCKGWWTIESTRNGSNGMSSGGRLTVLWLGYPRLALMICLIWHQAKTCGMNQKERFARVMNSLFFFLSSFRKFSSTDGIYICESDRIQLIFEG